MADNRRAGERTILRGDVEGNDTLAEISRALETERRAPVAVGAGFVPPTGGQVSNIPAMADLEDELLREFALYEGPREPLARDMTGREPARKVEPSFAPAARPAVADRKAIAPSVAIDDDDDTMPPMDGSIPFRAARAAPIVRAPVAAAEPARIEPEPPVVFDAEPETEMRIAPSDLEQEFALQAAEETVQFSGPVPDLADWDLEDENQSVEAFVEPMVDVAEHVAAEPAVDVDAVNDDAEPVFAGPVPDFDFEDEPQFAGPVPEVELDDSDLAIDEPAFAGPVPDFDFDEVEPGATAETAEPEANLQLDSEPELSLGALDLRRDDVVEPTSPFAAWKNDRLAAVETTTPAWLSAAAVTPKRSESVEENAEFAAPAVAENAVGHSAVLALQEESEEEKEAPASSEFEDSLLEDFEFELDADDLVGLEVAPEKETVEAFGSKVEPASDVPVIDVSRDKPSAVAPYLSVEPEFPSFAALTATAAAGAAVDPVLGVADWLKPMSAAPVAEAKDELDFKEFEFDFDEDAIEAEVSRAVMSELQVGATALPPVDEMPFDPTAITEIEDRMPASFGNMDVPQVPETEGETVPKPVSDFDYDIEAEMAELFAMGSKTKTQGLNAPMLDEQNTAQEGDSDGLANEIIRSIHEAPAIPAGRAFDMADVNAASTGFVARYARLAAFAAIVAFAGLGAVMLWRSGDVRGVTSDGTPRVIMADKSPIKEVPDEPGGKQVPNQDKAVYDRVAGKSAEVVKQGSLIANAEEPVNVAEKTLGDEAAVPQGAQAPGVSDASAANDTDARLPATPSQPAADGQAPNESVSPRKVKTMIVLPNGTLVARETNAPATPTPQAKPTAADAAMTAPAATAKVEASQPAATITPAAGNTAPASQPTADKAPATKPVATPVPKARPADQPVNVVGTVTQRGNTITQPNLPAEKPAAQQAAATKPVQQQPTAVPAASNAPAGSYVIQIASLPSEAEAQKSYSNLSAKFSSVIGGKSPDIKPAEIPGKGTYYRLRVVAGSKDEAIALCARYKAAGGSCLVSR
ncbi:hypothetical protein ABID16_001108 [Rhizobium aquaticum]|uniref:SPOR domain-containing protein n=1 Tax=Rhizobium aquaticum TaxID=1549636 RepID=A0ABV2IWK6_9HYPH